MRIAHVVSTFAPQIGGMGSVCADEAMSLAKYGHEVTVFTLNYSSATDYQEHDKQFSFKIVRLKALVKMGDAGLVPQILKQLKNNFDLVHLHYPFYGGAEWLYFSSVPLVVTYHMDAQATGLKSFVQKVYDTIWPRLVFSKAKKIMLVEQSFRESKFLKNIFKDKIVDISNGVDLEIFKSQPPNFADLNLTEIKDKKIILFVGNILPLKRLDLLIRAIKLINDYSIRLLVVGGGYELHRCQQLAKDLGVDSKVLFAGPCQDQRRLVEYYNIATCVAVPSDYESFSLVAVEALACGVPLVASDLPVLKMKLNQAIFFTAGSADGLVNALRIVLSMSAAERQTITEKGRDEVNKAYNWQDHMKKLEIVYKQVVI
jgi:glycosyltransferase involved in cell wall biosynthesis